MVEHKLVKYGFKRMQDEVVLWTLLYQITHNITDTSLLDLFATAPVTTTTGHNFKPRCYSRCRQNFFSYRTIDNWNKLPPNVVNAGSINSFKNLLEPFTLINYLLYHTYVYIRS